MSRMKFYNHKTGTWEYADNVSGISEDAAQEVVTGRFEQLFVISPTEPEHSPCVWFDTSGSTESEADQMVYFVVNDSGTSDTENNEGEQEELTSYYRHVTFMTSDNATVAKTVSVAPVYSYSEKNAPTQTKESTVDTVYTHSGWSLTPDGEVSNILSNITEDITLYPVFTESVRYYTIRFYDGDTLIQTERLTYGSASSYTYDKTGARFLGWNPEPKNIESDMDCYGSWEFAAFATDSWTQIAAYAEAGVANEYYNLGDEREITMSDGEKVTLQIVGFNPSSQTVSDTTGITGVRAAGITITAIHPLAHSLMIYQDVSTDETYEAYNTYGFKNSYPYTYLHDTVLPMLPEDLREVLVYSSKLNTYVYYGGYTDSNLLACKLWIPSLYELCGTHTGSTGGDCDATKGGLSYFTTIKNEIGLSGTNDPAESRVRTLRDSEESIKYWLRTPYTSRKTYLVNEDGSISAASTVSSNAYVIFAFCL